MKMKNNSKHNEWNGNKLNKYEFNIDFSCSDLLLLTHTTIEEANVRVWSSENLELEKVLMGKTFQSNMGACKHELILFLVLYKQSFAACLIQYDTILEWTLWRRKCVYCLYMFMVLVGKSILSDVTFCQLPIVCYYWMKYTYKYDGKTVMNLWDGDLKVFCVKIFSWKSVSFYFWGGDFWWYFVS
jgi:hypothetical protein